MTYINETLWKSFEDMRSSIGLICYEGLCLEIPSQAHSPETWPHSHLPETWANQGLIGL